MSPEEARDPELSREPRASEAPRGFFALTVARPVACAVLLLTLVVVGVLAYREIPTQLLPSGFGDPELNVWIPNPGASAQENEEKVTRVIEEQLETLSGITNVLSWSRADTVYMRISFSGDLDLDLAKAEVRDRIERARPSFPDTVERVETWSETGDTLPLSWFGILHKGDSGRTDYLMDRVVRPRLESVQGVSKIDIFGDLQDSVRILLDEDRVIASRMDIGDLIGRLSRDNFAQPLGDLNDGGREVILRSDMRFKNLEEIERYPIGNGLTIGDVGEVRMVKSVRNNLSRIDGDYSYFGMATKDSRVNVVEASRNFEEAIAAIEADPAIGDELSFVTFFVQGTMVESSLAQLRATALWGGVLAVVVLFVFLRRVRLTLCVALSIPVAALLAIAWEYFSGSSFNVLTMAGLTLAMGMLVDNSVVVVENIARYRVLGLGGKEAARKGAREIGLAVTLATLTTVVVFMPLIFMADHPQIRVIFKGIGLPLCIALLFSLLIGLVFLPVIAARILGDRPRSVDVFAGWVAPIAALPARLIARLIGVGRWCFHLALRAMHRVNRGLLVVLAPLRIPLTLVTLGLAAWLVVQHLPWARALGESRARLGGGEEGAPLEAQLLAPFVVAGVLASAIAWFGLPRWRRRHTGGPRRPQRFVPAGSSLIEMITELNRRVVSWSLSHRWRASFLSLGCFLSIVIPMNLMRVAPFMSGEEGTSVEFRVSFDSEYTLAEAQVEMALYEDYVEAKRGEFGYEHWSSRFDNDGGSLAMYWEVPERPERTREIRQQLKEELPRRPGHRLRFYDEQEFSNSSNAVTRFVLRGPESQVLEELGAEAVELLRGVRGLSAITSPLDNAPDQLLIEIDRDQALARGVSSERAVNSIAYALRGWALPRFHDEGRELPLIIEFDAESVAGVETVRDLSIWTDNAGQVPLSSFSTLKVTKGDRSIFRMNGQTTFNIQAQVDDPTRNKELNAAGYALLARELKLPRGYTLGTEDSATYRQQEEFSAMKGAFLLSVVLVFLLMGILFESVLLPFSVLFTIPFAMLGAIWTIFLSGTPMDFMGWIGLIILAGVVVNNGIVLIDRIHSLAREGVPRREAVVTGCAQRVRPVLMTALTTIVGLLPMALSEPATNSIPYQALATIVAGGLAASTFFTLWVVPLVYTLLDDLSRVLSRRLRWALRPLRRQPRELAANADWA